MSGKSHTKRRSAGSGTDGGRSARGDGRLLLFAYGISGAAALAYEVGWMRELSAMLGATAYASGTMLSAYMAGLGLGTLLGVWLSKRVKHPLRAASRAELAVAVFSVFALLGIRFFPGVYFDLMKQLRLSGPAFLSLQFAASFAVMLLPTIAMGTTYPLMMEAVGKRGELGAWSGRLYSVNTAGAIVGSLATGFVLIPLVGVKGALFSAALLSSVAAVVLATLGTRFSGAPQFWRSPESLLIPCSLGAILLIPAITGTPLGLGQVYYFNSAAQYKLQSESRTTLYQSEGIYSRVTVVQDGDGLKTLSNGALDEGNNGLQDQSTTAMIAIAPAASTESTKSALVIGLGTGFTSAAYQRLGFDHVTTVEINPDVLPASSYFVGPIPEGDPRWEVVVDDARAHILTNPERYDAISSEPSWPWSSGVAALFTREFVAAAKTRLNPGGVYCQWLPNYILQSDDVKMMYRTMSEVYPRVDVWAINLPNDPESELLFVGHNDPGGRTPDEVLKRIDEIGGTFATDNYLVRPGLVTPYSDIDGLVAAAKDDGVPLNTDDHSTLEYRVFWNFVNNAIARTNGQ